MGARRRLLNVCLHTTTTVTTATTAAVVRPSPRTVVQRNQLHVLLAVVAVAVAVVAAVAVVEAARTADITAARKQVAVLRRLLG